VGRQTHVRQLLGSVHFDTEYAFTTRLPGPPISNDTALVTLLENNVLVGIGTTDAALVAQTRLDLAWVGFNDLSRRINWILIHIWTSLRQRLSQMGEYRPRKQ
jgi:hypothetical protein